MRYVLRHQQQDGGFEPIGAMAYYMVLGASLLYTGHGSAALRLMPFLRGNFVDENGDFDMPEVREGKEGILKERGYAPAWMIFSSHVNMAFDMSLGALPHLLKYQDPETGGLFGTAEECVHGKGVIHPAVTAIAGQAALVTGALEHARRMGDHFVDNLIAFNPDLSRAFYPVWDTERGLRTDSDTPSGPNMPPVLIRHAPNQHHYLTGMTIGFLSDLYRATRGRKYLDGALELYRFAADDDEVYRTTASHKFAWGCAWLYRETSEVEHLESACRTCDYLISHAQESDGSFVHWAFVKASSEWNYPRRLNITAQFALWIWRTLAML